MIQQTRQLNMSFEGDCRLASAMRSGQFCFLLEMNSPPSNQPLDSYMAAAAPVFKKVGMLPGVHGIAVTDRWPTAQRQDPVDFAAEAMKSSGKPVLMTLSGRGADLARAKTLLAEARAKGIRCFLAVTGDWLGKNGAEGVPTTYLDSVTTTVTACQFGSDAGSAQPSTPTNTPVKAFSCNTQNCNAKSLTAPTSWWPRPAGT